jgi:hypothetical protein
MLWRKLGKTYKINIVHRRHPGIEAKPLSDSTKLVGGILTVTCLGRVQDESAPVMSLSTAILGIWGILRCHDCYEEESRVPFPAQSENWISQIRGHGVWGQATSSNTANCITQFVVWDIIVWEVFRMV